eukprot:m.296539 g.296539  ORF g.296539 m.296539 type:complete len:69 (-) comp13415_c0_seq1:28-234(-)
MPRLRSPHFSALVLSVRCDLLAGLGHHRTVRGDAWHRPAFVTRQLKPPNFPEWGAPLSLYCATFNTKS